MFECAKCGQKNPERAKYCRGCGGQFKNPPTQSVGGFVAVALFLIVIGVIVGVIIGSS